jgi:hypothetical protein
LEEAEKEVVKRKNRTQAVGDYDGHGRGEGLQARAATRALAVPASWRCMHEPRKPQ